MRTHFIFARAILAAVLAVACSDKDSVHGAATSAGAGPIDDFPSENGGQGGAGDDASENGGRGGAGDVADSVNEGQGGTAGACWVLKAWSPDGCGACEMTVDQYCADVNCTPDPLPSCEGLPDAYSIDEGCGLLRVRMSGHGGAIYTETVYDLATRQLKFYYDSGGRSAGCMPKLTVGLKPTCASWTTLCEGAGGA